jgi:hypothetical protein
MLRQKYVVNPEVVKAREACFKNDNRALLDYILDNLHPYASDESQQKGYDECANRLGVILDSIKNYNRKLEVGDNVRGWLCDEDGDLVEGDMSKLCDLALKEGDTWVEEYGHVYIQKDGKIYLFYGFIEVKTE